MGYLRFYRHVFWLAIRPSLEVADVTFYGVLLALALAAWLRPGSPELLGVTEREITLYVFAAVVVVRLLMAPYWAYREVMAKLPADSGVSGDWEISNALDYVVNDSMAELRQPEPPEVMEFGPMKGRVAVQAGVQHGDARSKINEALISGEFRIWGYRQIQTHIPNQFELSRREIPKEYWNDMQLDFSSCLHYTRNYPQTMKIPGRPEVGHWTDLRVSRAQIERKWPPKSTWRRWLHRRASKERITASIATG